MGRPPERAQQLRDLAEALRASAGGAPTRDTAEALGELFAARVERRGELGRCKNLTRSKNAFNTTKTL